MGLAPGRPSPGDLAGVTAQAAAPAVPRARRADVESSTKRQQGPGTLQRQLLREGHLW